MTWAPALLMGGFYSEENTWRKAELSGSQAVTKEMMGDGGPSSSDRGPGHGIPCSRATKQT